MLVWQQFVNQIKLILDYLVQIDMRNKRCINDIGRLDQDLVICDRKIKTANNDGCN